MNRCDRRGQLPKFLVDKLGKSVVQEAMTKNQCLKKPTRNVGCSNSRNSSRLKWKLIKEGKLPPDELYNPKTALEIAGLKHAE